MIIIGLTGGIASGKSTVARLLAEQGAVVLDADVVAHEVLQEGEVREALTTRWGSETYNAAGELDRRAVATRVFGKAEDAAEERRFLESLVHPRVRAKLTAELKRLASTTTPAAVLDIPLLLEAGWAKQCDHVLFIDADHQQRASRAQSRGWNLEELTWREAAQVPITEKRAQADFVISNSGSSPDLERQIASFWKAHVQPDAASG